MRVPQIGHVVVAEIWRGFLDRIYRIFRIYRIRAQSTANL
jgi:hypothetical protein